MARWGWVFLATAAGAALRLARLDEIPPGPFCDEAAAGYDAWSIWQTGRDQWGEAMPLFARSLGVDWDEGLYRWLSAPVVGLLGLSTFSTRLVAALAGIATIPAAALLAREADEPRSAPWAAWCVALIPWHVMFSRIAFRGILLPLCLTWGIALLLRAARTGRGLGWAAPPLVLALWTYSPSRVLTPVLALMAVALFAKPLWRQRHALAASAFAFVAFGLVLARFWISDEGMSRARSLIGTHSPFLLLSSYGSYFSPTFLFVEGDRNVRHCPNGFGELLGVTAPFLAIGMLAMLAQRRRAHLLLVLWLMVAAVPAALTEGSHSLRSIGMVTPYAVVIAIGVRYALVVLRPRLRLILIAGVAAIGLGQSARFMNHLFVVDPVESAEAWNEGMGEAIEAAQASGRPCIVASDQTPTPHVFFLFHRRVPPEVAWAHPLPTLPYRSYDLDRYHVRPIDDGMRELPDCVFIATDREVRDRPDAPIRILRTITLPSGNDAYHVFLRLR